MAKCSRLNHRLRQIPFEVWSRISKIDQLNEQWIDGAQFSPQVIGRLRRSVLISSTGASTRVAGANISDEDVEKITRGIDIQKFSDQDKQEVKGYFELLENVFASGASAKSSSTSEKSPKFSERGIKHFHKELFKYVEKSGLQRGEYKKIKNKDEMVDVVGKPADTLFDITQAYLVPEEMEELIEWTQEAFAQKKHHPIAIVGNFIADFLQIHPFQDGNGRLSRIFTNLLLLRAGYLYMPYVSIDELIEDKKDEYYLALAKSQKTFKDGKESIVPWLDFFSTILLEQSKMAVELFSKESIEKLLSKKQISVLQYLHSVDEASPGEISEYTKIARPTVSQALDRLLRFKKVERIGLGRSTRYRKI